MKKTRIYILLVLLALLALVTRWLFAAPRVPAVAIPATAEAMERGEYLVHAGGCIGCHQGDDESSLSGGMALESPFGTFYVPNITPDQDTGIGGWQARDFLLALQHGRRPDGGFYYPAFPYRAYAGMSDEDVLTVAAWLMAQPAVSADAPAHDLPGWLQRWMIAGWNRIADVMYPVPPAETDPQRIRGAYLVRNLGHCGECHTPRNRLGIPDPGREFAGVVLEDGEVEAITPQALADWTEEDIAFFLFLGLKPDGEFVGGEMEPVIEYNTSRLTENDRYAVAAFLKSLQPEQE
ncbi:MAG: cytochrome c [Pseudohongiellaceae bacterium]